MSYNCEVGWRKYIVEEKEGKLLSFYLDSTTSCGEIILSENFINNKNKDYMKCIKFTIHLYNEGLVVEAKFDSINKQWYFEVLPLFKGKFLPNWIIKEPIIDSNILEIKVPTGATVVQYEYSTSEIFYGPEKKRYIKEEYQDCFINYPEPKSLNAKEAEDKIKKIFDKSKYPIEAIDIFFSGEPIFPFFFLCKLGGGPLILKPFDLTIRDILEEEWYSADKKFNTWFYNEPEPKKADAEISLKGYLEKAMKYGYLIIPIKYRKLNDKDYSPWLFSLLNKEVYSTLENTVECLTEFGLADTPEKHINFQKKYGDKIYPVYISLKNYKSLPNEDYYKFAVQLGKIFDIYNEYVTKEYEEKTDDPKYQKRHDSNWENF